MCHNQEILKIFKINIERIRSLSIKKTIMMQYRMCKIFQFLYINC